MVTLLKDRFHSPAFDLGFGLYVGVFYGRVHRFDTDGEPAPRAPGINSCHWCVDVGVALFKKASNWHITPCTDIVPLGEELRRLLENYGLPELDKFSDDARFIETWRAGPTPGLPDFWRYKCLAIYLAEGGRRRELEDVLAEYRATFRGKSGEPIMEAWISKVIALPGISGGAGDHNLDSPRSG